MPHKSAFVCLLCNISITLTLCLLCCLITRDFIVHVSVCVCVGVYNSNEHFAGEFQFEISFESQKKVPKSSPWTVSLCSVFQ